MEYEQYHQKGGTYILPVEVFDDLLDEKEELESKYKKNEKIRQQALEFIENFGMDANGFDDMPEHYVEELYLILSGLKKKNKINYNSDKFEFAKKILEEKNMQIFDVDWNKFESEEDIKNFINTLSSTIDKLF